MSSSSYAEFYNEAEKEGNLNAGGTEILPAGQYVGVVESVKAETKADGKRFGLKVTITEGPLAGKSAWANLNLKKGNAKQATAFFITAEKFGLTKDFFFRTPAPTDNEVANFFKGTHVTIEITHGEWNGKQVQYGKIADVQDTGRSAVPNVPQVPQVPSVPQVPVPSVANGDVPFNPLGAPVN